MLKTAMVSFDTVVGFLQNLFRQNKAITLQSHFFLFIPPFSNLPEFQPMTTSKRHPNYHLRMSGLMLLADLSGLIFPNLFIMWAVKENGVPLTGNLVAIAVSLSLFVISRLYPGAGISPPQEIRMVTQYTLIAFFFGWFADILSVRAGLNHPLEHLAAWLGALVSTLFLRWSIRIITVLLGWWREPVIVIARGQKATELVHYFRNRLRLGYWPVLAISDAEGIASYIPVAEEQVIPLEQIETALTYIEQYGIRTTLVDLSAAAEIINPKAGLPLNHLTPQLIFISDMNWMEGAALQVHDYEGLLGVEAQSGELNKFALFIKSGMDFVLSLLALLLLAPWLGLIALLIKMDSPGPVFYLHERIGKGQRKIKIIKFRTMHLNAAEELKLYLQANPEAQREWEKTQKLRLDPRITRIGKILRKFSLDELPQLFNVLRGDLSLVGARPIVQSEIHHYGARFSAYTRFKPGLTGLWQVSGRNNTTYDERVRYDTYYIHNWSIWLDIYILIRTIWVVITREGAY